MTGNSGTLSPSEQLTDLERAVEEFIRCIESLPTGMFLRLIVRWTPRDVVAHLVGWNRYTLEGILQLRKGETPSYLLDPADDFQTVNAASVRKYASTDQKALLGDLRVSLRDLLQYLRTVDLGDWAADYGVRYRGHTVTIRNTVAALSGDYRRHQRRLEDWAGKVPPHERGRVR